MPTAQTLPDRAAVADRDALFVRLVQAAEARGLGICAWKDRDSYPLLSGGDLDLLFTARSWRRIEGFVATVLEEAGWRVLSVIRRGHLETVMAARSDASFAAIDGFLQIDLHREIAVGGIPVVDAARLVARSEVADGVRWLHRDDAAALSFLEPLIAHGRPKEAYAKAWREAVARAPERTRALATEALGPGLAERVATGPTLPAPAALRRAARWRAFTRRPVRTLAALARRVGCAGAGWLRPPGRTWTFCGPDGAGKSTAIETFAALVARRLVPATSGFHTRPYVLPRLATVVPMRAEKRHAILTERRPEPRIGLAKSVIRLAIAIADYWIGHWLRVRPRLARGELVIFDRYATDYLVDGRLRGIDLPPAIMSLFARAVPRCDRTVFVVADPAVLVARKGELDRDQAEFQVASYRALAARDRDAVLVDSTAATPEEIASRLAEILLGDLGLAERAAGR